MVSAAVSNYILSKYNSIPGESPQEKVTHVAKEALMSLPWIASGVLIYQYTPSKYHKPLLIISIVLPKVGGGSGSYLQPLRGFMVVAFLIDCRKEATNLLHTTRLVDRFVLLAKAYVSFKIAANIYSLFFTYKKSPPQPTPEVNTTPFATTVTALTTAAQIYFATKASVVGLVAGISMRFLNVTKRRSMEGFEFLFPIAPSEVSNKPLTTSQKIAYIWDAWDTFAETLASPILSAFRCSVWQGQKLFAMI